MPYKAVLFDMGGVLVRYRDPTSYERLLEMAGADPEVARQIKDFDYGTLSAEEIIPLMRLILPDFPKGVTEYSALENYTQPNEDMLRMVRRLKKAGLKVALVTNNGFWSRAKQRTMLLGDISCFDLVVESCKVGIRKPDSEIFNLAVEQLGVAKEECIFLDDSKENCEGAEREGIRAIYVENGNTQWAMAQLEHLLGLSLSGRAALVTLGCEMNLRLTRPTENGTAQQQQVQEVPAEAAPVRKKSSISTRRGRSQGREPSRGQLVLERIGQYQKACEKACRLQS